MSFHTPFANYRFGAGFNVFQEEVAAIKSTYASGAFAYHININRPPYGVPSLSSASSHHLPLGPQMNHLIFIFLLLFMFIFSRMRVRYVLMVFSLRDRSAAISFTVFPEAIEHST